MSTREARAEIDAALALLRGHPSLAATPAASGAASLHGLLDLCERRLAGMSERAPVAVVRTVHHLACTGGTLISKALAALPNTVLSSEVDPLSTLHLQTPKRPFFPTDLIADLRYNPRVAGDGTKVRAFQGTLRTLLADLDAAGFRLVLRDHSHSHFCHGAIDAGRPTLRAVAAAVAPVLSVLTVRNPLDSFTSLRRNLWVHFAPDTLEEYCRRQMAFLDAHAGVPFFRYEDFVRDPVAELARMAGVLELPMAPDFEDLMPLFALSGDSGRSEARIAPRPRGEISLDLDREAAESATYRRLCIRLGYEAAAAR